MRPLKTEDDLSRALEHSNKEPIFIYKHSATCPVSHYAQQRVSSVASDYPVYKIVVQQARALSNNIADKLCVGHETPQLIKVSQGEAVANISHGGIKEEFIHRLWISHDS